MKSIVIRIKEKKIINFKKLLLQISENNRIKKIISDYLFYCLLDFDWIYIPNIFSSKIFFLLKNENSIYV